MEWRERFLEIGFTHDMDNWRSAMIASTIWNSTFSSAGIKLNPPASVKDFLPSISSDEEFQEPSDKQLMEQASSAGGMRFEPSID